MKSALFSVLLVVGLSVATFAGDTSKDMAGKWSGIGRLRVGFQTR
jgi:hypothetical protein